MGVRLLIFSEDHLNFLPPKARAKAIMLDEARSSAMTASRKASDGLEEAWFSRDKLERDIRASGQLIRTGTINLARHPLEKLRELISGATDEDRVTPILAKAELEIKERLEPRRNRAVEAFEAFAVVDDVARWLDDARRAGVRLADALEVKLPKKDFRQEVERIRAEITELEARFETADFAPLPLASVREAIIREIDMIAERGRPTLSYTTRRASPINLERALGFVNSPAGPRTAETLVWAMQDIITERALSLVGNVEPENALTDEQREALLEKLAAERLEAERFEEALIMAAFAEGTVITRRREADPRAVLEVIETSGRWRSRHDVGFDDVA